MKINHDIVRKIPFGKNIQRIMSQKSLPGFIMNRVHWHIYPRLRILREYPVHVDIELSSLCQLDCPMCFRRHRAIPRQGNMTFETFSRIVDELDGRSYSLKFTGRGEGLMNKDFPRFMDYLRGKNFGETAMITNGLLMRDEHMSAIIDADMSFVSFSIDGLKETYEKTRHPGKYEDIHRIVTRLHSLRTGTGKKRPLLRIQSVNVSVDDERRFLELWGPISDDILFLYYKDYGPDAVNRQLQNYVCPLPYQRMMIHFDGTVPLCINDEYEETVIGNVHESSIAEIWKGAAMNKVRVGHRQGRRLDFVNCSHCCLTREEHGK